jgi:hypothetical protein
VHDNTQLEQTFKQVGQAAAQQGGDLLTQALQGALLAGNGTQSEFNRTKLFYYSYVVI